MNIVIENDNTITAYVSINGRDVDIIHLAKYRDNEFSVGSSTCLPSNINKARVYLKAMNAAFEAMDDLTADDIKE